ncbi:MAG: sigma-70 family RNA polymerase sigma factor [Thermoanaerobaculia bacterium]
MNEQQWLAERFEEHRAHLGKVAYRMLGDYHAADDAVQEAWLRLSRSDASDIANLGGWLTTVVARVCLDALRSRNAHREESLDHDAIANADPEDELLIADSLGVAVLIVLETLTPAERVAFVLHDMFDVPFDDIAEIVGRNAAATRQLASRARRRVRGADVNGAVSRQREIVDAFLEASRAGDVAKLVSLLAPNVVVRADAMAVKFGATPEQRGVDAAVKTFAGRAQGAQPGLLAGMPGLVWPVAGKAKVAFAFTIENGTIIAIDLLANEDRLRDVTW